MIVQAVRLEDEEIEEVQRALRWIGLHPLANEESTKSRYAKRGDDVRRELHGMLTQVTQGNEPLFRTKLQQVKDALVEIAAEAWNETYPAFWTERGTDPQYVPPLVEARHQAVADVQAALKVIEAALEILPEEPVEEPELQLGS